MTSWPAVYRYVAVTAYTARLTPADERLRRVMALHGLSPVARAIRRDAPLLFWHGETVSTYDMARAVSYSPTHTRRGLLELVRVGMVRKVKYAPGRVQYAGNPQRLAA